MYPHSGARGLRILLPMASSLSSLRTMTGRTGHLVLLAGLLAGCRIEDRTPTGSRRDQAEIQRLIYAYHRSAAPDPSGDPSPGALRVVRLDLRQEGTWPPPG